MPLLPDKRMMKMIAEKMKAGNCGSEGAGRLRNFKAWGK